MKNFFIIVVAIFFVTFSAFTIHNLKWIDVGKHRLVEKVPISHQYGWLVFENNQGSTVRILEHHGLDTISLGETKEIQASRWHNVYRVADMK